MEKPKSFKVEVIADSSGRYVSNDVRLKTSEEAENYARDLMARWTLVTDWRVAPSEDEPNR